MLALSWERTPSSGTCAKSSSSSVMPPESSRFGLAPRGSVVPGHLSAEQGQNAGSQAANSQQLDDALRRTRAKTQATRSAHA